MRFRRHAYSSVVYAVFLCLGLLPAATYSMLYGGILVGVIALIMGIKPSFSWSLGYISSLLYLTAFGSFVAMVSY